MAPSSGGPTVAPLLDWGGAGAGAGRRSHASAGVVRLTVAEILSHGILRARFGYSHKALE